MSEDRELLKQNDIIAAYTQKGIVPITFIGDDIESDNATNTLYTLPYRSMIAMQQSGKELQYDSIDRRSVMNSIVTYLEMNIYGMIYDTLVAFTDQVFTPIGKCGKNCDALFPADKIGIVFSEIVGEGNPLNIRLEIKEALERSYIYSTLCDCVMPPTPESYTSDLSCAHISHMKFTASMDQVFSILVESVFNRFINLVVEWNMNNGKFVGLFAEMWKQVYGGEDKDDKMYDDIAIANNNPAIMVEFVAGYMRAIMETYMPRFRAGLDMLSWFSAKMSNEAGGSYGESNSTKES